MPELKKRGGWILSKGTKLKMSIAKRGVKTNSKKLTCGYCLECFDRPVSLATSKESFCSKDCYSNWMRDVRKTEDHPLYRGIGDSNAKLYRERGKSRNPQKYLETKRIHSVIYRIRRRGLGGEITKNEWLEIKNRTDFACLACGRREPEIKLVADHIIPVVRWEEWLKNNPVSYRCGDRENIQALCVICNCRKSSKLPSDYDSKRKVVQQAQINLGYAPFYQQDIQLHKRL